MERVQFDLIDVIRSEEALTIPGLLLERAARDGESAGFTEFADGVWRDITWSQISQKVAQFRDALDAAGMMPGDRVALWLPNSTDWVAFDIAAMANGLIPVPLYMHDSPRNALSILEDSGARLCFLEDIEKWRTLTDIAGEFEGLEEIWLRKGSGIVSIDETRRVRNLSEILSNKTATPGKIRCKPDDVATLIYTSGTTGKPKGVMLSHRALLWNAEAITEFITPHKSDVFLSVLPAAHAFERTIGYHLPIMCGSRIAFARSVNTLREDMLLLRPTVLTAVPRLYERFHDAILNSVVQKPIKAYLTRVTANIGWRIFEAGQGRCRPPGVIIRKVVWPVLQRLVGRKVLQAFGGRIRVAVSGGAALPARTSHFLIGLGLPLFEGYGLTETAPVVTAASFEDNKPGSVGRPVKGVELRVSDEGELLIRSRSMMKGYWRDPERTSIVLDADGWLKTGDLAEIRDGRVFIMGRLAETIVLSTGKKVSPVEIETRLQGDPLFDQVCILGNHRPCLVAFIVLNPDVWTELSVALDLKTDEPNHPAASAAIRERIADLTVDLAPYSKVRNHHALLHSWSVEDGTLTPTLKIRRHVIEERCLNAIENLYEDIAAREGTDTQS